MGRNLQAMIHEGFDELTGLIMTGKPLRRAILRLERKEAIFHKTQASKAVNMMKPQAISSMYNS